MLSPARGRVVVAATVVAVATTACAVPGRGAGSRNVSFDDCKPVRLEVDRVNGMTAKNVVLAARLTLDGRGFGGQTLRFSIRATDEEGILWVQGGKTGTDGRVALDLADTISRIRKAREAFDRARILEVEYVNPAEERNVPPPGWCSTETRVPFEPAR